MPNGNRPDIPTDARLTLTTLGVVSLCAERPGELPVSLFEIGKPVAVIAYLAFSPGRSARREHLLDLLWADLDPEPAKHALRQTLWYIRKRLGDRLQISGGDTLVLDTPLDSDRDRLLDAAERVKLNVAIELYTGDFFPGFAAPGGAAFEQWADVERMRLRSLFTRSAEALVRSSLASSRVRAAQSTARRVRDLDPMHESGWRLLLEALIAADDRVAASVEADAFERLATQEGITPEPATRALLRVVRQSPSANGEANDHAKGLVGELVGREHEFAAILAAWEDARGGRAAHVHVLAPAGLGKSRLLGDVQARLRASRARAIAVRASLGAREIPYSFASDLALALAGLSGASGVSPECARALVALNPSLSSQFPAASPDPTASDEALRHRTVAIRELIGAVSDDLPLAVFIDDVQWADAASRRLLSGVLGTLDKSRVLMVTASRPAADAGVASERASTIRLEPLTTAAVTALVASIGSLPLESWAESLPTELWQATGGSPLLVLETLQLCLERGLLARDEGAWSTSDARALFEALEAGGALRHRIDRLERSDAWLVTLLAVGGTPLRVELVANAAARQIDDVAASLSSLEQRGLVTRHHDEWSTSHDELVAMAIEVAGADALRAAGKALGRALADSHDGGRRRLRQAARLLSEAGDYHGVGSVFARFARDARSRGDRRTNAALARDLLGDHVTTGDVGRLTRSLPIADRAGLYSTRRQVAAAAALALLPVTLLVGPRLLRPEAEPPPDAILVLGAMENDSTLNLSEAELRIANIAPGTVIRLSPRRTRHWALSLPIRSTAVFTSPIGDTWLVHQTFPDSGGIEIVRLREDSTERRLTFAKGDDDSPGWAPDGSAIAFKTARWSPLSHYDIAVMDVKTGHVRQLTSGDDSDGPPVWSPDGARIAFGRFYWDRRPSAVCVTDAGGGEPECVAFPGVRHAAVHAWLGADRLIAIVGGEQGNTLVRIALEAGRVDTIAAVGRADVRVSPDGRWALCQCPHSGFRSGAWILFPIDAPNRAIELELPPLGSRVVVDWRPVGPSSFADRLTIDVGPGSPLGGTPHLLRARGTTVSGQDVALGATRWRSLDTSVALVDSSGILRPKRAGLAVIEVSAGGWRTALDSLTVLPAHSDTLLTARWTDEFEADWIAYGDPRPAPVYLRDGTYALRNNGEGSFSSGVLSKREFSVARGVAVDAQVSVRVTAKQWQIQNLGFDADLDTSAILRWDRTTGDLPRGARFQECIAMFPGDPECADFGALLVAQATPSAEHRAFAAPPGFRRGRWIRFRVQIFPDGRCGVAVNGKPLWLSSARVFARPNVRVVAYGNSSETDALVGPVDVLEGVPGDIDWSEIGVSPTIPAAPTLYPTVRVTPSRFTTAEPTGQSAQPPPGRR